MSNWETYLIVIKIIKCWTILISLLCRFFVFSHFFNENNKWCNLRTSRQIRNSWIECPTLLAAIILITLGQIRTTSEVNFCKCNAAYLHNNKLQTPGLRCSLLKFWYLVCSMEQRKWTKQVRSFVHGFLNFWHTKIKEEYFDEEVASLILLRNLEDESRKFCVHTLCDGF